MDECPGAFKRFLNENGFFAAQAADQFKTQRNRENKPDILFAWAAGYGLAVGGGGYPNHERMILDHITRIAWHQDLNAYEKTQALRGISHLPSRFRSSAVERAWDDALYYIEHHAAAPNGMDHWNAARAVRELNNAWKQVEAAEGKQSVGTFGSGPPPYLTQRRSGGDEQYDWALEQFRRAHRG